MLHPISTGQGPRPAGMTTPMEPSRVQPPQQRPEARAPMQDQYIPEEPHVPTGQYWMGRDEDGQPAIFFDAPEAPAERSPEQAEGEPAGSRLAKKAPEQKEEKVIGSTDQVDREIKKLREEREKLQQQLNRETDQQKAKELKQKLANVERELRQKDTDAYRRQHTVFTRA